MILLDTSMIIEILRKNISIITFLKKNPMEALFTTEISIIELYYGIHSNKFYEQNKKMEAKRISEIEEIIHHFTVLPFDRNAALKTAQIMGNLKKQGNLIDFRDGMIGGISLANGISKIATNNIKHFEKIDGLTIIEF